MKGMLCFAIALMMFFTAKAQPKLQQVAGLPTSEVYDLHVDKKGYLWVAHKLGISRFDGLNFVHFSHPAQTSLSIDDIVEDNQGRIWCHNFNGQIFYVERGQMKLLQAYNYAKEVEATRIAICGNELLATSDHGLFVCSTIDFQSKYMPVKTHQKGGITSLAAVGNKTVLFDGNNWFLYSQPSGVSKLASNAAIDLLQPGTLSLQPSAYGNLVYLIANPSGVVEKLWLKGDRLDWAETYETDDFINAVSVGEQSWVHTRNRSRTLDGTWVIEGQSLTDAVTDKEGNTWFSSLKKGLLVNYKKQQWEVVNPLSQTEDFIRCLNTTDGYFFAGTNKGTLMVLDSTLTEVLWETPLFERYGSIEFIRFYKNHRFVVGTSVNTFIVNPPEQKVEDLLSLAAVKDVDFDAQSLYLATSNGVYLMPYLDAVTFLEWQQSKERQFPFLKELESESDPYLFTPNRSSAIRYEAETGSLFVSFKNGLHQINNGGIRPFTVNDKPVFASSLWYSNRTLFIGTFSDGLFIKKGNDIKHYTTGDILTSSAILRTKAIGNHLWLFENESMQVLDIETERLLENIDLPKINGADVFDVAEWRGFGYLTTADGVFKIPMSAPAENRLPQGFLDAVIVSNKDTITNGASLPYESNDLQFVLSAPAFYDPSEISFKYRLKGADDEWQTTQPGERVLRYALLPPGNYQFEAIATNKKGREQPQQIDFEITINKPWWKQWWFYGLILLLIGCAVFILEENRVKQLLRVEKVRRTIASDLHDDIGATLSSINIYTELAKKDANNAGYLNTIQQHTTEVIGKLDDLIWSINPRNDSFAQLISRMHSYAASLLQVKNISCNFQYTAGQLQEKIPVQVKQNLYLIFKELINNVIKHSGAENAEVKMEIRDSVVHFSVKDDGKGFDRNETNAGRNGLENIRERVQNLRGKCVITAAPQIGTKVAIAIPLPTSYVRTYKNLFLNSSKK